MICLFDIDGTLVSTHGAGRRAYDAAFAETFGPDHGLLDFSFSGMTDPLLVRRGLEAANRDMTEELYDRLVERYLVHLRAEIDGRDSYTVHPGVHDLVAKVAGWGGVALGLGTGNVEEGARMKLEPAGLNDYFGFGGFGCDAEDRGELLRAGAERGAARLGQPLDACRVVVVGDTTRDVEAARDIGAECIAVGTGGHDSAAVRDAQPDLFVEDLRDERVVDWLR